MGRVQLYCPSTNKTIDDFVIGAFQKPEQVLQGVRLALDIKHAALYTVEAKPITDPHSLQEDQRVLVAASSDEKMLPDAPYGYVRYDGEEIGDIDQDTEGYGMDWQDLTDAEKRIHIVFLADLKPMTRNKLRTTRDYAAVRSELISIQQSDLTNSSSNSSSSTDKTTIVPPTTSQSEELVQERWGMSLEQFLRQVNIPLAASSTTTTTTTTTMMTTMKYTYFGAKSQHVTSSSSSSSSSSSTATALATAALTPATVAALAVLASFSQGQARLVAEVLSEAIAMRLGGKAKREEKEDGVREDDIAVTVEIVYEKAGVIPVKLTKGKKPRKRAKARKAGSGA